MLLAKMHNLSRTSFLIGGCSMPWFSHTDAGFYTYVRASILELSRYRSVNKHFVAAQLSSFYDQIQNQDVQEKNGLYSYEDVAEKCHPPHRRPQ